MLNDEEKCLVGGLVYSFERKHFEIITDESIEENLYKMIALCMLARVGTTAQWRAIGYKEALADAYGIPCQQLSYLAQEAETLIKEAQETEYEDEE